MNLPETVEVVVEVPRGGFVKRGPQGAIDYVSPIPCPFNYGSIPEVAAADGDPLDAVLLGTRRPVGWRQQAAVLGVVHFIDAGVADHKVICGSAPMSRRQRAVVTAFFTAYALVKRAAHRARGRPGRTEFVGWL